MGKRTTHVVVLPLTCLHQLLKLGHDPIPTAVARIVYAETVVDLLAPIEAQHHVAALAVGKIDHIVVDLQAVGGEGKAEILMFLLLNGAGIGHQVLHHLEVHQRLTAEEVHLQVAAAAGVLHKEIQRTLTHLKAHDGTLTVILALTCKAVGAVEVAGMGHMEAQGLHHTRRLFLQLTCHRLKGVGGKELSRLLQGNHLSIALGKVSLRNVLTAAVFLLHGGEDLFLRMRFKQTDDVVGHLVHHMDSPRTHIQHHIVTAQFILMNHSIVSPLRSYQKKCRLNGGISLCAITCSECSRTADWRYRSWSCKRTGRKSGTRRSRRSSRSRTDCGSQWS